MKIKLLIAFFIWCFSMTGWAATAPLEMLQSTTDQVLAALDTNKATLKSKPAVVRNIINQYLLPHVALETMARSVLGRTAWNAATPTQRDEFVEQFKQLLITTYSSAFAAYTNQTVNFLPLRGDVSGRSQVQISSQIIRQDGPPISVNYQLVLEEGEWKVFDFSVDNISMLGSFRAQFSNELSQNGLDALIQRLAQHNAQLA